MAPRTPPTEDQLRDAYQRAGLARLGITYEQAMSDAAIRGSLMCMTNADRHWAAKTLGCGARRLELMNKDL